MNIAAAAKSAAAKALHWRVVPAPRNLNESRQVLGILQDFGEVSTFKWLKYDKPAFENDGGLVIFRDETAVQNVLRQSPIHFMLERTKEADEQADLDPPSSPSNPARHPNFWHSSAPTSRRDRKTLPTYEQRPSKLYAEPWTGDHRAYNERQKFFNPIPRLPYWHPIRADLAKRVPLPGLADVILEPKGGEIELDQLRRWARECDERPRLREWVRERQERVGGGSERGDEGAVNRGRGKRGEGFFDPLRTS